MRDERRDGGNSSGQGSPDPEKAVRYVLVRAGAVVALVALTVLAFAELTELRGELGFMRFDYLKQLAAKSRSPEELAKAVQSASAEGELVMLFSKGNPDALLEISTSSLRWSGAEGLDPVLRLRLGEKAVRAAGLAVRAAPSDYEPWLWLARTQAALGLLGQAQLCLERAQQLAPPGEEPQLLSARP